MSIDVLVCNLTRFGDLLQGQTLINDLQSSGHRVGLLCLDNFSSAVPLLRGVDAVWQLPGAKLLAGSDHSWPQTINGLLKFRNQIIEDGSPRSIINLTPSLPARLLTHLLSAGGAQVYGFNLDNYGFGINTGVWGAFFSVATRQRINAPFNLADLMAKLGKPLSGKLQGDFYLAPPPGEAVDWAKKFIAANIHKDAKALVSFQLGASEERRRWPYFSELGDKLWHEKRIMPILLGSKAERKLAEEYAQRAKHPYIDAIGKTSLMYLAALLRETKLLITNDTGTMHLASGQGVKCLAFFLATAQPCDTGPLLTDCCCLEPAIDCHPCQFMQNCANNNKCRAMISPRTVAQLVSNWLDHGDWRQGMNEDIAKECRVWLTSRDKYNFQQVQIISNNEDARSLWLPCLRQFWSQLLDDLDYVESGTDIKEHDSSICLAPQKTIQTVLPYLENSVEIIKTLIDLSAITGKSKQAGQIFLRNCDRLQTLLDSCAPLSSLSAFWRELRQNQGTDFQKFL